jgi:hypothetical protein
MMRFVDRCLDQAASNVSRTTLQWLARNLLFQLQADVVYAPPSSTEATETAVARMRSAPVLVRMTRVRVCGLASWAGPGSPGADG